MSQQQGPDALDRHVATEMRFADWAKESAVLIALAMIGIGLEYPLAKTIGGGGPSGIFISTLAPVGLVPIAVWLVPTLGLPGAPWLSSMLRQKPSDKRFLGLVKPALLYSLLAVTAESAANFIQHMSSVTGTSGPSRLVRGFSPARVRQMPERIATYAVSASIGAGIYEEIAYRLVVLTLCVWLISRVWRNRLVTPGAGALWCANLLQGYVFGLMHLMRGFAVPNRWNLPLPLVAMTLPQTWAGVVFGHLYLSRGLEAAILSHLLMDAGLFLLLVGVSLFGSY
ncbi:MAG TPA: CPBP family intramembrane glutamic endopeptidase [Candidatus Binataceae bacterium]|nr:CPBP family intramembrane glutamic endopeptidase [Candidatus Binataceae bacterium]